MKKIVSIILISILMVLTFSACNKESGAEGESGKEANIYDGGIINISARKPDTYNPLVTEYESSRELFYLFYDSLFVLDEDFSAKPNLAQSFEMTGDSLSGILKIKEGVNFSDGSIFSSEDVCYTVDFIMENKGSYFGCVENIEEITLVDRTTVYFKLKTPEKNFKTMLTFPIIKKGSSFNMDYPLGTGQFVCNKEDIGHTALKCARNRAYHLGRPYIEGFNINFVNSDIKTETAFISGDSDIYFGCGIKDVVLGKDGVNLYEIETNRFEFLGFNCLSGIFSQIEVRRAVYEALGKIDISEKNDISIRAKTPLNPNAWFYVNDVTEEETSPQKILEDNGWTIGSSGIYKKGSDHVSFKILVNKEDVERNSIANLISRSLISYGISSNVEVLEYGEYIKRIENGEFDAFLGGTAIGNATNVGYLFATGGGSNVFGYSGGVMDIRISSLSQSGDESLEAETKKFKKTFAEGAPAAGLYFKKMYIGAVDRLSIQEISPTGVFTGSYTWHMIK